MRLLIAIAFMCITVAACHTWRVQPGPSSTAVADAAADSTRPVRLTLTSGAVIEISALHFVGDSVVGVSRSTGQRVAFAVTDVQSVARREVSARRTALLAGGVTVLAFALLLVVAAAAAVGSLSAN